MLTSRAPQEFAANWLKFDTDECGRLNGVEGRASTRTATAASDDVDDDDDNPWANAWNIPDNESEGVTGWLQQHPEVATITDGVEKTCNDDNAPVDDLDDVDIA
jgi:hypothetical protein